MSSSILAKAYSSKSTPSVKQTSAKEKTSNEWFINIGIPVETDEGEVFINIPLTLTADHILKSVEVMRERITEKTPFNIQEIVEGKAELANSVVKLFEKLEYGEGIRTTQLEDNEDEQLALLSRLEVQFFKYKDQPKQSSNSEEARKSMRAKLFGK